MVGLTEFDKELKPAPVIAKSWEILDGGRKIVFQAARRCSVERRQNGARAGLRVFMETLARSQDRVAVRLHPVSTSLNAAEYAQGKLKDPAPVGVNAADDHTLVVTLSHPASYFLAITTFEVTYPQRQDIIEKHDTAGPSPAISLPTVRFSWHHGSSRMKSSCAPTRKYFRGKPAMEKVTIYMVNEKTTALTMYEQGNLDFIDESHSIPTLDKPRLAKMPEYKLVPQLRGEYYGFAVDRKPFDNPKCAGRLRTAIDREVFPKILQGGRTPATSWIPPGMLAHNPKDRFGLQSQRSAPAFGGRRIPGRQGLATHSARVQYRRGS